jgi:hypothetical protein
MRQDFSDAGSSSDWQDGPYGWHLESRDGGRYVVDVIHDDQTIASLDVEPLPDYRPTLRSERRAVLGRRRLDTPMRTVADRGVFFEVPRAS